MAGEATRRRSVRTFSEHMFVTYPAHVRDKSRRMRVEFDELVLQPSFRDFVCMYIGEGAKRCRNTVALCDSDPNVIILGDLWIRRLARKPVTYSLQYHADFLGPVVEDRSERDAPSTQVE
jgi:hypothetical protein